MKQVVVIGGGHVSPTYDDYLSSLRNLKIENLDYFKKKGWKMSLEHELGNQYEVLLPSMPCRENAKYIEWKIWFEKLIPFLNNDLLLVGHSLGGLFLAKYLSEERCSKKIQATFLIATPHDTANDAPSIVEFVLPGSLALLAKQGGTIFFYHSKDDPVVPFSELAKYQTTLPNAVARVFADRSHFNQETFPELVADIKTI